MKTKMLWLVPVLITAYIISSCSPKSKYDRMLERELESGVRYDSLFMGLYLGMPEKEFYTQCWKLNSKGLIRQGTRNMSVEYQLKDELNYPGTMDFYPEFINGKIFEMPVRFLYNGWAPWNKKLCSDSLQVQVLKFMKKSYGEDFMEVSHPKRGIAYVKINGNRRISIFKENEMYVWVVFTDMIVQKEVNSSTSTIGEIQKDISNSLKE